MRIDYVVSANGHDFRGQRFLPVLLKDVAGLVPGAWEGKGRGNRQVTDTASNGIP